LLEPDPNSKIYRMIKPGRPDLVGTSVGVLADSVSGLSVLEYGPTEILPPVGANRKALRISADPVAEPAAHTRAKSRGS
jgi:hypothetical protein